MKTFSIICLSIVLLCCSLGHANQCHGKIIPLTPDSDWFSVIHGNGLQPGDEVVLSAGVYSSARRLVMQHRGMSDQPIVIRAATDQRVVFKRPDAKQNSMNLEGCQHLVIRGIEITGGAAAIRMGDGSDGVSSQGIVLEQLHIHHIGGVAVTCNNEGSDYRQMVFRRNHIHHTSGHGEAFYLGANNAKAVFADSLIEQNYIHHLNGPNVSQGDGIEIKHGSFGNRIVGNVIHDTQYPGVTVYGTQGGQRNIIEGNVIWNAGDHGIQAAADAVIRGNWITATGGCGIYSREHQGAVPGNLLIEANLVVANDNPAIRIIGSKSSGGETTAIELKANRLFAAGGLALRVDGGAKLLASDNQGSGGVQGSKIFQTAFRQVDRKPAELPPKIATLGGHPAMKFLRIKDITGLFDE